MTLSSDELNRAIEEIGRLLVNGELSLLLGSGFSIENKTELGAVPGSDGLKEAILQKAKKTPGARTSLKDAYLLGHREIADFPQFLSSIFTVSSVPLWQEQLFYYVWKRIYTTNIDNVLNVAREQATRAGKNGADFEFFNYCDRGLVSETLGTVPVVTIHGTCTKLEEGFIFSSLEYARATAKILDWHRDLAAKALTGGLLVVGNQLDESDLEAYIADRAEVYGVPESTPRNWIVMPTPDPIKAENYLAAGYTVIDSSAERFFSELFSRYSPRSMADIVVASHPGIRKAVGKIQAMAWFKAAMHTVVVEIDAAKKQTGILRHFITGAEPSWFFITQAAHARTSRENDLTRKISLLMTENQTGVGVLHVTGPSGSGKTTAIKSALLSIIGTHPYISEFNEQAGLNTDHLRDVIANFTSKSIFVFYSSAEFYYAIAYITQHFAGKPNPFCLFILEERTSEYRKNHRQLKPSIGAEPFEINELSVDDATSIARKIEEHGLQFTSFSELSIERRAKIIVDKERGYGGDLLTTLFSLTTHENFELKIHEEYFGIKEELPRKALESVAIVGHLGLPLPLSYLAGFLGISPIEVHQLVEEELAGVVLYNRKQDIIRCRHRIIADYYFRHCISKHGSLDLMLGILSFLSRQFTVSDIRQHPLPYRIYKELISCDFLFDQYFSDRQSASLTEAVYHECQSLYGTDGIFWLQFGRFYRRTGRLDDGIDCFKTGLSYFDSFQTRHSLGVALLERYLRDGCSVSCDYEDGVKLLENERISRGASDAYPTGTLIDWLMRVGRQDSSNLDAKQRLRDCINFAIKHFKDDDYVAPLVAEYFRSE